MNKSITEILKQKESQNLEFKTVFGKEAIETITAFSNTSGGVILIGVADNNEIIGIDANYEIIKDWSNSIKQVTQPQIFPEITLYEIDNKTVAYILVQEFPIKPISFRGKYFKRVGASNHQIPLNEIVEMQLYCINSSFDSFLAKIQLVSATK